MFGHRFFGGRYYGPAYWGDGGDLAPPEPPVVVVTQTYSGGWETPEPPDKAAIRRERQRLGIIPADPEPVEIAGTATHIGPAEARDEPIPGETKPETTERDFTDLIAGTAMAKAMRDAEDEAIAVLLLMA